MRKTRERVDLYREKEWFNLSGCLVFFTCQHFPLNLFCLKHDSDIKVEVKTHLSTHLLGTCKPCLISRREHLRNNSQHFLIGLRFKLLSSPSSGQRKNKARIVQGTKARHLEP